MRKTLFAIAAVSVLTSPAMALQAAEHTIICQHLGDATVCNDGTIIQPFGDGAYVTREPRDKWGQPRHDNDGKAKHNESNW